MAAIEMVTGFATAPGVAAAAAIGLSNGTLVIRNFSQGNAWLVASWKNGQAAAGDYRIRSPRMHDFINGLVYRSPFGITKYQAAMGFPQRLIAQDVLTVEVTGSAVALDQEHVALLIYYEFLDGANGRYIDLTELEKRLVNLVVPTYTLVGAVTGAWGAGVALNAAILGNVFKANTDYAILGFSTTETAVLNASSVALQGVDTGSLFVGGPVLHDDTHLEANWFIELTKKHGRPMIPVINSANFGGTLAQVLNNENANTVVTSVLMAELR